MSANVTGMEPLITMFSTILSRLDALEAKVGIAQADAKHRQTPTTPKVSRESIVVSKMGKSQPGAGAGAGGVPESVRAFDTYYSTCVVPLSLSCDDFDGEALKDIGKFICDAWEGMRGIIVLATKAKLPDEDYLTALAPFLEQTQESVKKIYATQVHRDYDRHFKAITEMLACLSWVLHRAPKQIPSTVVKDAIGSSEFWSNRIRKDHKDSDDHIAFCDNIKKCLTGLVNYIESYHKTGLTWNPRGVSLAEATALLGDEPEPPEAKTPAKSPGRPKMSKRLSVQALGTVSGANVSGLMSELAQRKSADGHSAATGLKHVSKDQQTWRKEYKKKETLVVPNLEEQKAKQEATKKKGKMMSGLPIFEYQDRGFKWLIENQTKQTASKEYKNGIITVEVTDPKQQVYLYNCNGITVQVKSADGVACKFKSLVVDKCTKCNVVFQTIISSADIVNSARIQLQANGVCPIFSIDKTNGILIWLSEESKNVSSFVASQSSEMNVSFPDGDDQKELPIPEQFVHRLQGGSVKSEVSDLYH